MPYNNALSALGFLFRPACPLALAFFALLLLHATPPSPLPIARRSSLAHNAQRPGNTI